MTNKQIFLSKFGVLWTGSFVLAAILMFKDGMPQAGFQLAFIGLCLWPSRLFIFGGWKLKVMGVWLGFVCASLFMHTGWM